MSPRGAVWLPAVAAFAIRATAIALSDRVVADVLRYHKVAGHLLDVSWNPYLAARLYPYPPVWMWMEMAAEAIARATGLSFAILVKLPVLAAEIAIVVVLARLAGRGADGANGPDGADGRPARPPRAAAAAAWVYALHPVAVLVSGFHGQFDSLPLLAVLLAIIAFEDGRRDASALALAAGIALKSFPILLLPVFLLRLGTVSARARYAALAGLPVAAILLPFAIADARALARELAGYGGVADFGWIGAWRAARWMEEHRLLRAEAVHWGTLVAVGKVLFLAGYVFVVVRTARRSVLVAALAVLVAFEALYGAISAQYLLWVVPFAAIRPQRSFVVYTAAATVGLAGFYLFLAPGVLVDAPAHIDAGVAWAYGVAAIVAVSLVWLVSLLRSPEAA